MPLPSPRAVFYIALALILLGGNLYAFWPFWQASQEMQAFCSSLPDGASLASVKASAEARGYVLSPPGDDGHVQLEDPQSYGRRTCDLRFGGQGLRGR